MIDDMGIFRTDIEVAHVARPEIRRTLSNVMVDTGSEYNWVPASILRELGIAPERVDRFETASREILERPIGFAWLSAGGRSTVAVVVFGEPDDVALLGAHGLEGLNVRVDLARKELVSAGPVPVGAA